MENNQPQPDYSKGLSKEEIIKRLTDLPIEELRIRYNAFESAKRKMIERIKEKAKTDPELAKRLERKKFEKFEERLRTNPVFAADYENWKKHNWPPKEKK